MAQARGRDEGVARGKDAAPSSNARGEKPTFADRPKHNANTQTPRPSLLEGALEGVAHRIELFWCHARPAPRGLQQRLDASTAQTLDINVGGDGVFDRQQEYFVKRPLHGSSIALEENRNEPGNVSRNRQAHEPHRYSGSSGVLMRGAQCLHWLEEDHVEEILVGCARLCIDCLTSVEWHVRGSRKRRRTHSPAGVEQIRRHKRAGRRVEHSKLSLVRCERRDEEQASATCVRKDGADVVGMGDVREREIGTLEGEVGGADEAGGGEGDLRVSSGI